MSPIEPGRTASLAAETSYIAGIDIGGTTTQAVLCTPDLEIIGRTEMTTPARRGGEAMMDAVVGAIDALRGEVDGRLVGVGVGAAGVVDSRRGRILVASDSFVDWAGNAVTDRIEDAFEVPAFLDNDVNAFLRGEVFAGAVRGEPYALGVTLGTGVGGALWMDGRLYEGPHGAAGEIGHFPGFGELRCSCGGRGHLETLASGRSIAARYAEVTGMSLTAREIAARAVDGDAAASAVYFNAGRALARAIVVTADIIDVVTVVVGGGVSRAWDLLAPALAEGIADEPPISGREIRVTPARLGSDGVALGAAARALTELESPRG